MAKCQLEAIIGRDDQKEKWTALELEKQLESTMGKADENGAYVRFTGGALFQSWDERCTQCWAFIGHGSSRFLSDVQLDGICMG